MATDVFITPASGTIDFNNGVLGSVLGTIATMKVYDSLTTGNLSIQNATSGVRFLNRGNTGNIFEAYGTYGNLFTVSDDLTDSIFSVNTSAGVPVLDVYSNNSVYAGQYGSNDFVINSNKVGIGTKTFTYTINDNSRLVGSNTNNKLFISGSVQLLNDYDAFVIGRGTATFLSDEELGFGWGGGWYMTDGTYLRVRNDKVLYTAGEIWGSIFKDSNNTAYYVDPAGTSNLVGLTVTNTITGSISGNAVTVTNGAYVNAGQTFTNVNYFLSNKGATSTVGANNSYALEAFSSDAGAAGMSFHRGGYYAVNMGLDPDNVLRIGGWSASANRWELDMSGNNWVASSFRAPIFYDSNNTSYYVDPASTSVLNALTVGGNNVLTTASTLTAGNLSGTIPSGVLGNSTVYIGTTAIALNRGSASQSLTGVNIDGSSGSCTGNAANVTGTVAIANGGTGATSAAAAATNLGLGTGNTPKFVNVYAEKTAVTSAASTTVNTQYNVTELTLSASVTTLTLSNIQASPIVHMWTIVTLGQGTAYSITWPAAVKWPGGTAPTLTSTLNKRDIYQFVTYDGGTNIYAIIVGQNL